MTQECRSRLIVSLALCGFALYLALGIVHHEAWRDEWQAINIARAATSLPDLFERLRYEGHPVLWFLCIRGAWELFPALVSVQILNAAFALLAAGLVAFCAPWPLWLRLLLAFSGPAAWEFSVKARSYGLGWLLIVILALVLRRPADRITPWLVVLLAALALNTSIFTGFVAFSLVSGWLWQKYREQELRPVLLPLGVLAVLALVTFWLALPPADVAIVNLAAPQRLIGQDYALILRHFADTLLPFTNIGTTVFPAVLIAAIAVIFCWCRYFSSIPGGLVALLCGWFAIFFFLANKIIPVPYPWHLWHLFLMPLAVSIAFEKRPKLPGLVLVMFAVFGILGLSRGIREYGKDWQMTYAGALPAALAIKTSGLAQVPIVAIQDHLVSSLSGYLGHPLYDGTCSGELTYKVWKKVSLQELDPFGCACKLAGTNPEKKSIIVHNKRLPDEALASLTNDYHVLVTFLGEFTSYAPDENIYMYLVANTGS